MRRRWAGAWFPRDDADLQRYLRTVSVAAVGSLVVYLSILWNFGVDPLRKALRSGDFANFYDLQARALLHGHLNLPRGSLGIEGFIEHGREYMYFPPGPALARMPLFLFTSRFDGRLTAVSMLLAWVATTVLLAMLMWRIRRILRGRAPLPQWEATAFGLLLAASVVGSSWLYLASMPWVYHEAYAWAIATAVGCTFTILGVIQKPAVGRIVACAVALQLAVLTRATTGLAMGLAIIATGIWFLSGRRGPDAKRHGRLLLLAALPLLVGVGINWAKFEHPYMFRLQDQVWTSVNEHRREALAINGTDMSDVNLLPTNVVNYFRPDGIRFIPVPPFITFPSTPAKAVGGAFLDQSYRTGSTVPFMPVLVLLGAWGLVTTFRPRGPGRAAWLRIPVLASGAISGAMMIYGYISYRYVSELLPVFYIASAIGLVDLGHLLTLRPPRHRRWFAGILGVLTAFAVLANGAVSYSQIQMAKPGMLASFLEMQESFSDVVPGDPVDGTIHHGDHLPTHSIADSWYIVGDCDGVYFGQAETDWLWEPVDLRGIEYELVHEPPSAAETARLDAQTPTSIPREEGPDEDPQPDLPYTRVVLATVLDRPGSLFVDVRTDSRIRLGYRSPTTDQLSEWVQMSERVTYISVVPNVEDETYHVIAGTAHDLDLLQVPVREFDTDWIGFQNLLTPAGRDANASARGIFFTTRRPPPSERCSRWLDRATR